MSFLNRLFFWDASEDEPDFDVEQIHEYVWDEDEDELS